MGKEHSYSVNILSLKTNSITITLSSAKVVIIKLIHFGSPLSNITQTTGNKRTVGKNGVQNIYSQQWMNLYQLERSNVKITKL